MAIEVKICGVTTAEAVRAAAAGARYIGLVFHPASPRGLTFDQARALAAEIPLNVMPVALVVDADDLLLAEIIKAVPRGMLQLHGNEPPARVAEIRRRFGRAVIKAIAVGGPEDLKPVADFADVADRLLFDARPPAGAGRPGGNAVAFDWSLLRDMTCARPWFLAGGLDPSNVAAAVRLSGARAVDVSSGVEDGPGRKSVALIKAFLDAVATVEVSRRA